jgi:hypothetical protein
MKDPSFFGTNTIGDAYGLLLVITPHFIIDFELVFLSLFYGGEDINMV